MKRFAFVWDVRGALDVLSARAWLGPVRAADLDAELADVRARLAELPLLGPPAFLRGRWSPTVRKLGLKRSPYHLYYAVDEAAGEVVGLALRHERQRPLRRL